MSGRDPRYRPYRASLWILYFGAIALGVGILVVSVGRQLRGPPRRGPAGPPSTRAALRVCMTDLDALFREQNERALALAAQIERPAPFEAWGEWARGWEARVGDLSDRCGLDADDPKQMGHKERTEMAAARDAILAVHRAYSVYVQRFAAEHGDLVRAASEALAHARSAVAGRQ